MLRLLPANGKIQKGSVRFEGRDVLQAQPGELQRIRGGRVGLIFQEPSMALHPAIRVGEQVSDVLAAHVAMNRGERREKTLEVLATLFPVETKRISESYPHQLSGGQQQRVLMAQAIACGPAMLIADEPTASLDPSTQQEILGQFRALRQKLNLAMILITHNPVVLAGLADRILVLYAGRVAEMGPAEKVLTSPQHPYTKALLQCLPPRIAEKPFPRKSKLTVIAGDSPNLAQLGSGCRFEPRCRDRMEICVKREPEEVRLSETHGVACFKYGG
jgi:oligopeptide/dipeptide ABC transporter ATP-binding protein